MAGPVALPPVDQRESTARSPLVKERRDAAIERAASMRLAGPVTNATETSGVNRMNDKGAKVFTSRLTHLRRIYT